MNTKLSICIPSYNRGKFLPDLLSSIVAQYDERVEIVICDNGSQDYTEALVRSWMDRYPRIVYERFEKNVGPDRCFLRSVEMASGSFCWLMGDDDIIEPGALNRVLEALKEDLTGITVNRAAYDVHLKKRWMEPSKKRDDDRLFLDAEECFSSLFVLFGFLSAQIVKRSAWLAIAEKEEVSSYFNAYVLIYIIGRMIQEEPRWLYMHTPSVGWRSGNDSFAKELGRYKRFELDVIGYGSIAKGLFSKQNTVYKKIMKEVCSTHLLGHVRDLKFKEGYPPFVFKGILLCLPKLYNISAFWVKVLPALLIPGCLLRTMRPLYRLCVKGSR